MESRHLLTILLIFNFIQVFFTVECVQCSNPPPGTQKTARGVDITKLDLVPLDVVGSDGIRSPVLSFTCDEGKTWKSPKGTDYQLPDQIWEITSLPGGWLSADVNIYKSYDEVRNSMTTDVGLEGSIWKFAFSASQTFKRMQNTITNTSRYISDVGAFESATRVDLIPSWVLDLDKFAQMFLDNYVNGTFEINPSGYKRFIETFGTHYFNTANFGGYIRVLMETKTDYFYSRSDSEVQRNAKVSFLKFISAHGGQVSTTENVDETFTSSTTQTVRYYGGNTNLLTEIGISEWQPTVDNDPWQFAGELKPLSDLIKDAIKKSSMERAVENYVLGSYLDELQRLISFAKGKADDAVLIDLQTRLTSMKSLPILVLADVEALGKDVDNQIKVPSWFTTSTKLCFKWWADGDGGQCGGGADNMLCAKPNSMTPVYRDDTDHRPGGCRMQWGIQSTGQPSWFNDVKVCYQWYGDDDVGQCGGGADQLLCAGINQFSPAYRDDSDSRDGGCRMSWKLDVPSTAPLWLRTAKMCFSWYPDDDGGQCGPAPSRDLCAVASQWTEYYRDDTDHRNGGCRMSWGFKIRLLTI